MKTLFEWLTMPIFRERTGMFIGRRDIDALNMWIQGYRTSCEDAGEYDRLRTPNGVPIELLRDYITLKEHDTSTGGIPYILQVVSKNIPGSEPLDRFFYHIDALMKLKICSVQRSQVSSDARADSANDMITAFRKVSLTDGLCWVVATERNGFEYYWNCIGIQDSTSCNGFYKIGPETEMERLMQQIYGKPLNWEIANEQYYPKPRNVEY